MKGKSISVLFIAMLILASMPSFAGTFYVCDDTQFKLKPDVTTFALYEWSSNGTVIVSSATPDLAETVDLASATAAEVKTYTLRVQNSNGCWSVAEMHTVHILPKLTATISDANDSYCSNASINGTLTADSNRASITNLPSGVSIGNCVWSGGTTPGTPGGANNSELAITSGGTYTVTLPYTLPANNGESVSSCAATDTHTPTINTPPATPSITLGS